MLRSSQSVELCLVNVFKERRVRASAPDQDLSGAELGRGACALGRRPTSGGPGGAMLLRWRSPAELILSVSASNIGWKMGKLSISKLEGRLDGARWSIDSSSSFSCGDHEPWIWP